VPLVRGPDGVRLAKRHGAVTLDELTAAGHAVDDVVAALVESVGLERSGGRVARLPELVHGFELRSMADASPPVCRPAARPPTAPGGRGGSPRARPRGPGRRGCGRELTRPTTSWPRARVPPWAAPRSRSASPAVRPASPWGRRSRACRSTPRARAARSSPRNR